MSDFTHPAAAEDLLGACLKIKAVFVFTAEENVEVTKHIIGYEKRSAEAESDTYYKQIRCYPLGEFPLCLNMHLGLN